MTAVVADGPVEVRLHLVDAPPGLIREGGHALAGASMPRLDIVDAQPPDEGRPAGWARLPSGVHSGAPGTFGQAVAAGSRGQGAGGLSAGVVGVCGWRWASFARYEGGNPLGRHSAVTFLAAHHPGGRAVYGALHLLGFGDDLRDVADEVSVEVEGSAVTVRWPDGRKDRVDLAALF